MNELTNQAITTGTYNSIPTSLTSNISTVNLIDGITYESGTGTQSDPIRIA